MHRRPINRLEKTLHRMRGKHLLRLSLNAGRITFIALYRIKAGQMPAGTIQKEAKQLLEDFCYCLSLAAFTDAAKLRFQMRQQSNVAQVSHEKARPPRLVRVSLVTSTRSILTRQLNKFIMQHKQF